MSFAIKFKIEPNVCTGQKVHHHKAKCIIIKFQLKGEEGRLVDKRSTEEKKIKPHTIEMEPRQCQIAQQQYRTPE